MLIVANEPHRSALAAYAVESQLEILAPRTPLDVVQMLEKHAPRIAYVVVTSDPVWGHEVRQLIRHEYAEIESIALVL